MKSPHNDVHPTTFTTYISHAFKRTTLELILTDIFQQGDILPANSCYFFIGSVKDVGQNEFIGDTTYMDITTNPFNYMFWSLLIWSHLYYEIIIQEKDLVVSTKLHYVKIIPCARSYVIIPLGGIIIYELARGFVNKYVK